MRYTVALFSLPLVTANGRVRSVDNPRGNALIYLLLSNELADRSDSKVMLPDKDLFQNFICEYPLLSAGWIDLQRLFETFFDLRGKLRDEGGQRNIFIARNPKTSANLAILQQ